MAQEELFAERFASPIAVQHLAELSRLQTQAEQALQAREQDETLPPLLREVSLHSLAYALVRARREVETWTSMEQLEAHYPQVVQQVEWIIQGADRLAAGEDPFAGRTGFMFKAYRSELDGRLQPYGLYLPTDFDPQQSYPLVVMLHGYGGNPEEAMQAVFGRGGAYQDQGFIVATPYNRDNIGYANQLGEEDVWRVIQDVQQTCRIDDNRLYLTGHSMGGGGTLHLGMLHADRFAAIAAVSTWSDLRHAENALNLPIKLCHGAADPLFSIEFPRTLFKRLKELGYRVEYEGYLDVGHNAGDQAYRDGRIFSWFSQFVRDPYPRRVLHTTTNPTCYGQSYWTRMEVLTEPYVFGQLEAQVEEGNHIAVKTKNLSRFSLALSSGLVAMDQPVEVVVDGVSCFASVPPADGSLSFARSGDRFARTHEAWRPALVPGGGLAELRSGWHIFVYGTQGSQEETAAAQQAAERLAEVNIGIAGDNERVDITFPVKADTALTGEDLARANLILFGTPRTNVMLARIARALPVEFGDQQLVLAGETFAAEDLLLLMIHPNPLQPDRYVGLVAPLGTTAYAALSGDFGGMPDYVLLRPDGSAARQGRFDRNWLPRQRTGE